MMKLMRASATSLRVGLAVGLAALAAVLAVLVHDGRTDAFDLAFRARLLALDTAGAVAVWRAVSMLGSGAVLAPLAVLALIILAVNAMRRAAVHLALVMILAIALENGLKWLVHRARPPEVFAHTMPASYSFPSGHALFSFTFYVAIVLIAQHHVRGRLRVVALWTGATCLVLLIGASRLFLGVHYPSDVLGGYLVAALCICAVRPR